ncbi:dihydrofolate reductase [Paenibacillus athensensis]|uniref:Dihydrofolate reductase n=1 Tax=Paenibacillus athensensis TaxID=1967502 RepID=A0A4Y8PY22_9BACL|nr:dihydrofolate reductase [Paenibacillus athensensis]MCD1259351.1 dihydrofolate reductase [Paenibacillus athensensis]
MSITFIVAMDRSGAIGRENRLPWHLPADLQFFKRTTMGHPIVMGRKTYESIGKPLPGRRNLILTRSTEFAAVGCETVQSVAEAEERVGAAAELFVIGGAEVFHAAYPQADKLILTRIDHEFEADTYFSELNLDDWTLVSEEPGIRDARNPYDYRFLIYERKRA